jgi:small basic protein
MRAIPVAGLVLAFLLVYRFLPPISPGWADYVGIALLAGADALIGGLRARMEHRFDEAVFISGFFANMLLAALLSYLGDSLGLELYLAVTVALGIRIFTNLGRIRALFVTARHERRRATAAPAPE